MKSKKLFRPRNRKAVAMMSRIGKPSAASNDDKRGRFELCEKSQLRLVGSGAGMPLYRSFSNAPHFDRLEIAPQFGVVVSDLVAGFATIERCEQRICKLAPRDPQQFLQAVYGTEQIVWRCHTPGSLSEQTKATFCKGLGLIRTLSETPRCV